MIKVVICGTYRRDTAGLYKLFVELETCGVRILSPLSIDFISVKPAIVRTITDENLDISILETLHLRAMREADLIWLHAPDGYVGLSGSFELGYAVARQIPVVSFSTPTDEMLRTQIVRVDSVFEALSNFGLVK